MCSLHQDANEAFNPGKLMQAQTLLDAFRLAYTTGEASIINAPAVISALSALNLEGISTDSPQQFDDIRSWLLRRVSLLAGQYDPRIRRECIEIRRLAFFYHYYLTKPASYTEICSLKPTPKTRIATIDALLEWWAFITSTNLSEKALLPRHIKPEQRIIADLVPVATRSVGDNIRAAASLVFEIDLGRSRKRMRMPDPAKPMVELDTFSGAFDLLQTVCRMLSRQWVAPLPHVVPPDAVAALAQARCGLIVGEHGSGKSTFLRRIGQSICERNLGNAVLIDLHDASTRAYLDRPAALVALALFGRVPEESCKERLASGDLVLLFDHVEALPEADLSRLQATASSLPHVFLAVPEWTMSSFPNFKRFTMPSPPADMVKHYLPHDDTPPFVQSLIQTPLGLKIVAAAMQKGKSIDATAALTALINHAGFEAEGKDILLLCQHIAVTLAMQAKPIGACFVPESVMFGEWQEFSNNCRLLLRAGLLRLCGDADYQLAHPQLVRVSLIDSWISMVTSMASLPSGDQVITAARHLAETADQYVSTFLPSLVEAAGQALFPPQQVLHALIDLPIDVLQRHRDQIEQLVKQVNSIWQRLAPNDSQRVACIRDAKFHLRRHAPPKVIKPSEVVQREVAGLLADSEVALDHTKLREAVCLADASSDPGAASLLLKHFDSHPECQADLLIGALKANTASSFDFFCLLLQRPSFSSLSSAGYVAAAFQDGADYLSVSLLLERIAKNHGDPSHVADRYMAALANLMRHATEQTHCA